MSGPWGESLVAVFTVEHYPFPAWVKSVEGRMLNHNAAWEARFLREPEATSLPQALGEERAQLSERTDAEVVRAGRWRTWSVPDGLLVKWPIRCSGRIVAVGGTIIPAEELGSFLAPLDECFQH